MPLVELRRKFVHFANVSKPLHSYFSSPSVRLQSTIHIHRMEIRNNNQIEGKVATFGAGCFWGVQLAFQRLEGVLETTVGYCNGHTENPTYKEVCTDKTGHVEAIRIVYDDSQIQYQDLLKLFWRIHNPTTLNRQKGDIGTQYRSGIYYHDEEQRKVALASKEAFQKLLKDPIMTEIVAAETFYPAEEYHQRYLEKGGQCADKGCEVKIRCYG